MSQGQPAKSYLICRCGSRWFAFSWQTIYKPNARVWTRKLDAPPPFHLARVTCQACLRTGPMVGQDFVTLRTDLE